MKRKSTLRKKQVSNPEGRGGFGDHPEHIHPLPPGRPPGSIGYPDLLRRLLKLPIEKIKVIARDVDEIAINRIAAKQILASIAYKETGYTETLIDRVEGKPKQTMNFTGETEITVVEKLVEGKPADARDDRNQVAPEADGVPAE